MSTVETVSLPSKGAEAYVSLRQVQAALGASKSTVQRLRKGLIISTVPFPKAVKLPYGTRFVWSEIQEYITQTTLAARAPASVSNQTAQGLSTSSRRPGAGP